MYDVAKSYMDMQAYEFAARNLRLCWMFSCLITPADEEGRSSTDFTDLLGYSFFLRGGGVVSEKAQCCNYIGYVDISRRTVFKRKRLAAPPRLLSLYSHTQQIHKILTILYSLFMNYENKRNESFEFEK